MEMWRDGVLTWDALRFLAAQNQKRLREAQKLLGDPTQGVYGGPRDAESIQGIPRGHPTQGVIGSPKGGELIFRNS